MSLNSNSVGRQALAWGVHVLTASGVIYGLLAVLAIERNQARTAMLWLGFALFVDAFDGTLARLARVSEVLPRFDGAVLDLVIDYLTFVFAPALIIYRFTPLPEGLALFTAASILFCSLYHYSNRDLKTPDYYFVGFPALWNVVAFYLLVLTPSPWVSFSVILVLNLLTFTAVKCVHPFRVQTWRSVTIPVTVLWGAANMVLLTQLPTPAGWLVGVSLVGLIYFMAISLWRTVRGPATGAHS